MGARSGGGANAGMGKGSILQQPRIKIYKGTKDYKQVVWNANGIFWSAAVDRTDGRGDRWPSGMTHEEKKANWNRVYHNISKALDHVEANGNAFEKSVAQTIRKGLRKYDEKAFKVGYVSYKQSYIIGQALAETHYKGAW